jgi:hypothetical protein
LVQAGKAMLRLFVKILKFDNVRPALGKKHRLKWFRFSIGRFSSEHLRQCMLLKQ